MKIISEQECLEWLHSNVEVDGASRTVIEAQFVNCITYQLPSDTGRKTGIARVVSQLIDTSQLGLFWITSWGIFPSSENMALFEGYRQSLGEHRTVDVAPGHLFGSSDVQQLESLLGLVLYFYWDANLFDGDGSFLIKISHDECISIHANGSADLRSIEARLSCFDLKQI